MDNFMHEVILKFTTLMIGLIVMLLFLWLKLLRQIVIKQSFKENIIFYSDILDKVFNESQKM